MFLDGLPTSTITAVLILDGMNDTTRFQQLHNATNGVLKNDVDNDSKIELSYYRQLLNNIINNNVCFNQLQHAEELEEITAALERQFSDAGIVVNELRTGLDPNQVDNIFFIRSIEKMKHAQRSIT
ncbi:unnamed protein product [Adineta steineri]|uniref:Uncharacterized protein n=1 Tax=Adineta steineri TaxID=433720 RepID=A0A818HNC6_9BILA|nr:unnamed protein product [Adineta steineri]CAF3511589.1 unnamed protein product [Adineta steineri]